MKSRLIVICVIGLAYYGISSYRERLQAIGLGEARVCFLTGDMKNPRRETLGFEALANIVRLHFDANTLDECKRLVSEYCHARLSDGYVPGNLKMIYYKKGTPPISEEIPIIGNCFLEKGDKR